MRGIDPANNTLVEGDEARIRQAFRNMQTIAESEGAGLADCVRLVVYVTDMRPAAAAGEQGPGRRSGAGKTYPPRSIVEVTRLAQDDIFEVEGTFYAPG